MFGLGGAEILVILVVALLVLGPEKLPRFMRTVGRAVGDLRRVSTEFQRTVNLELTEREPAPAKQGRAVSQTGSAEKRAADDPAAPAPETPASPAPRRRGKLRVAPPRKARR